MNSFIEQLKSAIQGEVRCDPISKRAYSVDASIFEVEPIAIAIPKTKEEAENAVNIARHHNIPLIARGAATGIAGGCIGKGLILDTSKYLNRILAINYEEEYAVVEPGVVQDRLNEALAEKGYRLGPETSTGNRATLGGMAANNSAGSHSLVYGQMVGHLLEAELLLPSGNLLRFKELTDEELHRKLSLQGEEGEIYRTFQNIRDQYGDEIRKRFPPIPRRVSGYNLDTLLETPFNPAKIIAGSEGTLGILTELKVKISKRIENSGLRVIHFSDKIEAMRTIESILSRQPFAVEMIDNRILETGRQSPAVKNCLSWLNGSPDAVFAVELPLDRIDSFETSLGYHQTVLTDPDEISHVWEVRKAGLGLLLSKRSWSRAIAFIEDLSVTPEKLSAFMEQFSRYMERIGKQAGIYGHVGSGCMHLRPYMDLREPAEVELLQKIMVDTAEMILEHQGALSGEHGDGMLRSWLHQKMFGERIMEAFRALKGAFDPGDLMNPGKIVDAPLPFNSMRIAPDRPIREIKTFLNFDREGGFALSADLCNGNGQCRKMESTMCPSFQATRDEYDTTRARAQALRGVITGRLPEKELASDGIREILDLCLQCKGCKKECPSQVDMAKMKAETLFQHQEKHGYSLRTLLFGSIDKINSLFSPFAPLFNWLNTTRMGKAAFSLLGIAPERTLPTLARQRFSRWVGKQAPNKSAKQVVLYNDTFTEFNSPEIGISAYTFIQTLGYEVIVPKRSCCGRTLISKGMLRQAKSYAETLVKTLYPYAEKGIPIIGLEPSCILTLKDELIDLFPGEQMEKIAQCAITFDEWLADQLPLNLEPIHGTALLHGHCHQKALAGTAPTLRVLKAIPGLTVSEIPSGCCGMAGSFGYEKEHYALSQKIGSLKLFPALEKAPPETIVIADGFSCRSQIADGTGRKSIHLAEIVRIIS